MGVLISAQGLGKAMSHKVLFSKLDLTVEDGERLGIIGPNGAGKTTLLKIIAQKERSDDGIVTRKKNLKLAYVIQQPEIDGAKTVIDILQDAGEAEGLSPESAAVEAQKMSSKLGFEDAYQEAGSLSGGWKKRLAIGTALMGAPDLVLFDEPTNHLDLRSVLWLEAFLRDAPFAWVVVSHDRLFLDRTTQKILEINPMYPGHHHAEQGNYTIFMEKRFNYLRDLQSSAQSLANKLRKEDIWLSRQPKARGTKSQSRIDAAMNMKAEMADMNSRLRTTSSDIDFQASGRKSKQLVVLKDIAKSYGTKKLFEGLDLVIGPKMVIGILGDNGTGKSTLLKVIEGEVIPDQGERSIAPNLELVYFDQGREALNPEWTLKRAISEGHDSVIFQDRSIHVASWIRRFQFQVNQLDQKLSFLSGGEQAKVLISRLMLRKADVLLLDEPNNDLDIDTLEILEESLEDFPGAIVIISHDRYLLERLCTHFLAIQGNGSIQAYADYGQWEKIFLDEGKPQKKSSSSNSQSKSKGSQKAGKLSFNEQREWDTMEVNIQKSEAEVAAANSECESHASSPGKLLAATQKLEGAQQKLDKLYERWAFLENKAGGKI
ncbi:MAG: ABC-F family ATP-binding cassette domain-containing protein [Bdellovibrionota bacterium]|nr:MAG: ABC transporter ATP-binding protein [Pseudomonadota bacterium]